MKSTVFSFLFLLFILTVSLNGQTSYLAGTGQTGIEPYESLISLHLGGYGAPRDGRFTLQWINKGNIADAAAMAGSGDKLFIISGGEILFSKLTDTNPAWKSAGKAENIISIAAINGKLYGINRTGDLLRSNADGKVKFKKTGKINESITLIAASGNKLFATDGQGSLWTSPLPQSQKETEWSKSETIKGIIFFTWGNTGVKAI
jgi:hypothetical protein